MSTETPVTSTDAAEAMAGFSRSGPHRATTGLNRHRHHRAKISVLVALVGGVLAAGATFVVNGGAASLRAASGEHNTQAVSNQGAAGPTASLRVLSISPGSSADPVTAANPVRVAFSARLAPYSPLPAFSPPVAGSWHAAGGGTIVFIPAAPFRPNTEETLRIPGGSAGMRSATGALLAAPDSAVFQAGGRSMLRLEQLLAQLGYLPLSWSPSGSAASGPVAASYTPGRSAADAPAGGVLTWQNGYPSALTSQWQPGQPNVILAGALMAFQRNQGLPMTGTVSSGVWTALLSAAAGGEDNGNGYSFALVSKTLPETITVWHDGQVVVHGLANTGAADSPTPDGTFPVYLRRPAQVMRGLTPAGAPYADPVQFVSFFNGNYAVHSMARASYGKPQSLGCVELPLTEARKVWPYLTYGTLVAITG